jgi:flagellin-specific chaperone FliS|tara:strand:+ start:239 stop:505 length:267 start_codon:yes stop_codon:yes gene_type:complete
MKDKKLKDLKDEELAQKITDVKKELNILLDEWSERSSVQLEVAQYDYIAAKERFVKAVENNRSRDVQKVDQLFTNLSRPFYWSQRKLN